MFERERTDPQSDIEFDFFDEPSTVEAAEREGGPPRRRRKMPTRPPGGPTPSVLRLGLLIAGAILLAAVLVVWVNSCRGDQKKAAYQDYMESVAGPAGQSAQVGKQLNSLITSPGIKLTELRSQLEGLRQQQAQIVTATQALDAPGPLRGEQENLVEAMQFRVSGLDALAAAFGKVQGTPSTAESGDNLATAAKRLTTSDVVYEDLFQAGSHSVMAADNVTGVPIPESKFVQNTDFASTSFWKQTVDRLTQNPKAGGLHGNEIVSVIVQPGNQHLSPTEDNTVPASDRLSFQVLVKNSGDYQETQVVVTLTIKQSPPLNGQKVIDVINQGETKTVVFSMDELGGAPAFGNRVSAVVGVTPVDGETNKGNNTASYPIIFSLA
ncbi:MAG TPA: hypothetical protein VFW80_00480 [Gaiellaceae bacterium]|nr:hypothetical protein [Gaiellaceae bacterium]